MGVENKCGTHQIYRRIGQQIKPMWPSIELTDRSGTLLDDRVLQYGGYIELPFQDGIAGPFGQMVNKLLLPSMDVNIVAGHIVLNNIQMATERLLYTIQLFRQGRLDDRFVMNAINSVWGTMALELTGKTGLLGTYALGFRVQWSMHGHIATSIGLKHDEVGIPRHIYDQFREEWLNRCGGDSTEPMYVIAFRDPLLHDPSMRVLNAIPTDSCRVVIHPVITHGMNADSDGDLIQVMLGHPGLRPEEDWSTAVWDKEFLATNVEPTPDLNNILEDAQKRLDKFLVIGPHDLMAPETSEAIQLLSQANDIKIDELRAFFLGKTEKEIAEADEAVACSLILQKAEIGRIGAAAKRARVLANGDQAVSHAADLISERASQALFDSKHSLDESYIKLTRVLRKDGLVREVAESHLRECGINPTDVAPYLDVLYNHEGNLNEIVDSLNPTFNAVFDPMVYNMSPSEQMYDAMQKVVHLCNNEDDNEFIRLIKNRTLTLEEGTHVHKEGNMEPVPNEELQASTLQLSAI